MEMTFWANFEQLKDLDFKNEVQSEIQLKCKILFGLCHNYSHGKYSMTNYNLTLKECNSTTKNIQP